MDIILIDSISSSLPDWSDSINSNVYKRQILIERIKPGEKKQPILDRSPNYTTKFMLEISSYCRVNHLKIITTQQAFHSPNGLQTIMRVPTAITHMCDFVISFQKDDNSINFSIPKCRWGFGHNTNVVIPRNIFENFTNL